MQRRRVALQILVSRLAQYLDLVPLRPRGRELRVSIHHEVEILVAKVLTVDHHDVVPVDPQAAVHVNVHRLVGGVPLLAVPDEAEALPVLCLGVVRFPLARTLLGVRRGKRARHYEEARVPVNQGGGTRARKGEPGSRRLGANRLAEHLHAHSDRGANAEFGRPRARLDNERGGAVLEDLRDPAQLLDCALAHLLHPCNHLGRKFLAHLEHAAHVRPKRGFSLRSEGLHLNARFAFEHVLAPVGLVFLHEPGTCGGRVVLPQILHLAAFPLEGFVVVLQVDAPLLFG